MTYSTDRLKEMRDTGSPAKIGFIGLGDMGAAMAERIAKNGFELLAFDLRSELESDVLSWGGKWAETGQEVLRNADVVCICLYNDGQIRAFLDGENAFEAMKQNSLFVVFSTATPGLMREISLEGAAHAVDVVTAPVSGARVKAVDGDLAILASGRKTAFDRLHPLWNAIGKDVYWLGEDAGAGQVAKLCNNLVSLSVNLITQEAIAIAGELGIEENKMLDVLRSSSGNSWIVENWGVEDRQLLEHPAAVPDASEDSIWLKDIHTTIAVARAHGIQTPLSEAIAGQGGTILTNRYLALTQHRAQSDMNERNSCRSAVDATPST